MSNNILAFKTQVKALKEGTYNFFTARIIVNNLKIQVENRAFSFEDIGTTPAELNLILLRLASKPFEQVK